MHKQVISIIILAVALAGFACQSAAVFVRFELVNGLVVGDRVVFDGAGIGNVLEITYGDEGTFLVSLAINKDCRDFLTEYSRFTVIDDPREESRRAVEMILTRMGGAPLKYGSSVDGSSKYQVLLEMMKHDAQEGIGFLNQEFQRYAESLKSLSDHEQVEELERQIARLGQELKKTGRETREKIIAEIIPKLEKEIAELRERLEALGRGEEVEPLEKELEKIKYI